VGHIALVILLIVFVIGWITNATIMLLSPKLWFRLPGVPRGVMTENKYGRTAWGRLQVRLLGAAFLGVVLWIIWDAVTHWIKQGQA
jgi:hypothetical protein